MGAKLSGSSGKKYGTDQNSEINVTPFVDVMLVLLIIFMVAAPLATQSLHLDIPPPIPTPPTKETPPKPVLVQILENGDLYVGPMDPASKNPGSKVTEDQLPGEVSRLFKVGGNSEDQKKVFISAKADVEYGNFVHVMNTLEKSGFDKVGLVTEDFKENNE